MKRLLFCCVADDVFTGEVRFEAADEDVAYAGGSIVADPGFESECLFVIIDFEFVATAPGTVLEHARRAVRR